MAFGIPSSSEIISKSRETFVRFPLAMIASWIVTIVSIYLANYEYNLIENIKLPLEKIALSGSLAVFVFTSIRLLGQNLSRNGHLLLNIAGLVGIVGYYIVLPDISKDFNASMIFFRHFFLSLLFLVAFLWTPFIRSNLENVDYWEYAKHILFALVMASLFTIVAILGINGALFAVEKLFDIDMNSKRYFQVDIFIIGVFSVGYFLSQIPQQPLESRFVPSPPKVEKFFTKWLLTPLSGLYFVILYTYTAKVLFTMNWPKGIMAWLIVIFSTVAILTYLFWTHFAKEHTRGWRRWIWLAVLLQTVMLFIAIGMRILEYSWTESRYMVFVLGVWLAGISIYFLLFKNARVKWIFISMSLLIAITQIGPLNAYCISVKAQANRLKLMAVDLKKYKNRNNAPLKLRYEISDSLQYLDRRYKGSSIRDIFPKITKEFDQMIKQRGDCNDNTANISKKYRNKPRYLPQYITKELGFNYVNKWQYRQEINSKPQNIYYNAKSARYSDNKPTMTVIRDYDYMANITLNGYQYKNGKRVIETQKINYMEQNITLSYENAKILKISKEHDEIVIDMERVMQNFIDKYGKHSMQLEKEELRIDKKSSALEVRLEFGNISQRYEHDQKSIGFGAILFVKEIK